MDFFKNSFASETVEQVDPIPTTLSGSFPEWLNGHFLRVGPAKYDIGDFCCNHFFDGLAMLYCFSIKEGKVTFCKRFLQSDAHKKAIQNGRPVFGEFGTKGFPDTSKSFLSRMFSNFDPRLITDNGALNVFKVGNEIFACSETYYIRRVDSQTLETKEKVDLSKYLPINCATSHAISDADGSVYNVATSFIPTPKYNVVRICPSDNHEGPDVWLDSQVIGNIHSSWKSSYGYIHSFSISENYVIFLEQPLLVHLFSLATANVKGRCLMDCMDWESHEQVKFCIVNKKTGEAVKTKYYSDSSFFVFHHVNAYEVDNQIVMDVVAFPDVGVFYSYYLNKVRNNERIPAVCHVRRFVIPLIDDIHEIDNNINLAKLDRSSASAYRTSDYQKGDYIKLTGQPIGDHSFDMHCINTSYRGKFYRFAYGCGGLAAPEHSLHTIIKLDVQTGKEIVWRAEVGQYPGEPAFIPTPGSSGEDDGVVLSSVKETRPDLPHYLVILDGKTLTEIARAETTLSFPFGLHGIFIPEKKHR